MVEIDPVTYKLRSYRIGTEFFEVRFVCKYSSQLTQAGGEKGGGRDENSPGRGGGVNSRGRTTHDEHTQNGDWKTNTWKPRGRETEKDTRKFCFISILKDTRNSMVMVIARAIVVLFFLMVVTSTTTTTTTTTMAATTSSHTMPAVTALWGVRGGARQPTTTTTSYELQLEQIKSNVLQSALGEIEELRRQIVENGELVPNFGQIAETICNQALEEFAASAPDAVVVAGKTTTDDEDDDQEQFWEANSNGQAAAVYDAKLSELEIALDAPLQLLFYRQLTYIREQALQRYRTAIQTDRGVSEYEAQSQADSYFVRLATEATRESALLEGNANAGGIGGSSGIGEDWNFASERSFLQSIMNQLSTTTRQAQKVKQDAVLQHQSVMQFLQQQQQMIQQLQMQLYGQSSPWNIGIAYRIPDTNFNIQGSYQQGRTNVQLSCVPDEYAPFLGPNGFTQGVGPGNLGLSLNLSL